ncbi:MAG: ABC transporter ATP-binding protein [Proteobacteria bacterium]|nr:ABC transporter ATP-binding protein [Pseudomonadota bacterium]
MTPRVVLRARDLRVERRSRRGSFALEVDELELREAETLVVLGPNGAGKSTLLRALAGLETPARGSVEAFARGPATLVFQRPAALAGSVAHNVRAALLGRGLTRREVASRSGAELTRFGIAPLARRRAVTLSGGELRRLALARAFVLEPAILLLDEPFDDLDGAGQAALSLDLRRVIEQTGVSVAVVTHDLRRALLLGDRVAVLDAGRIRQLDRREAVLERPLDPAVARIVGMTNLVRGRFARVSAGTQAYVEVDAQHRVPVLGEWPEGAPVWLGIRPEHLKLDVGRGEIDPIGKGVVRGVVSDGVAVTATIEWAGADLRAHLLAGRGLARSLAPGDRVSLSVRPEHVHLMPA